MMILTANIEGIPPHIIGDEIFHESLVDAIHSVVGRRVRIRDLDQLIADAETTSRVNARTASAEGDAGKRRCDAEQFWGGL
jgi:hypothetical protein